MRMLNIFRASRIRNNVITRLISDTRGVTAVEFAIIGPVFFTLMFSALELGFVLTKEMLLDNAASDVSREIYTGAASNGVVTQDDLVAQICETVSLIDSGCVDNLTIELTTISAFQSIPNSAATCVDSDEPINPKANFNPGAATSIVYMRICLTTNIYTPGLGLGLKLPKTDNGKLQLTSALAFANEPF